MLDQVAIPVHDLSQVGEARRMAARMSAAAGLDDADAGRLAIVVTELATNLVRYGNHGQVILSHSKGDPIGSCNVVAIDSGPGMQTGRCLADGYSSGGTPGNGLGAVQRLASDFDIFSSESGSAVYARIEPSRNATNPTSFQWGWINLPAKYEEKCGDAFRISASGNGTAQVMIADGLGHGSEAAAASTAAVESFDKAPTADVADTIQSAHQAMAGSRGAAVAVSSLDRTAQSLQFSGVGNIAGVLFGPSDHRGLPSLNGIVGANLPRLRRFDYPLPNTGLLVMHSDGLQSRWSLDAYPGLARRHPALIAAILYRDFYRGRDDVTVVVGSWQEGTA